MNMTKRDWIPYLNQFGFGHLAPTIDAMNDTGPHWTLISGCLAECAEAVKASGALAADQLTDEAQDRIEEMHDIILQVVLSFVGDDPEGRTDFIYNAQEFFQAAAPRLEKLGALLEENNRLLKGFKQSYEIAEGMGG